jgi:putative tricarboxylic transport membrane protein
LHPTRDATRLAAAFLVALNGMPPGGFGAIAAAQWRPSHGVELVVPSNPGSGPDLAARALQHVLPLKALVPVPVTVVNRPGANNAIAWRYLDHHPEPGHALLMVSLSLITSNITGASAITPHHGTPIAQLFTEHVVFAVRSDSPVTSAQDLVRQLGASPGSQTLAVGGGGLGGTSHVAILIALGTAGADVRGLRVVAFKSSREAAAALLGGHVQVLASPASAVLGLAAGGKLRMIATSAPRRQGGQLAAVPTWREQGINAEFGNARTVFGPRGLTPGQVAYWETALERVTQTSEWAASLAAHHWRAAFLDSAGSAAALERQYQMLKALLGELGLARN